MAKVLSLVKTRPGVDPAAFRDYWANHYTAAVLAIPGLGRGIRRIVHNHAIGLRIRDDAELPMPDWAGIAETWLDSDDAARTFMAETASAAWCARHRAVFEDIVHYPCREVEIWNDGLDRPSVKMLAFFNPSAAMTREQSQRYWNVEHVAVGGRLMNPRQYAPRYVQNHVWPDHHSADPRLDFAGCPELWFHSPESAVALFTEPGPENSARLAEDEAVFSDRASTLMMVTDEVVVHG